MNRSKTKPVLALLLGASVALSACNSSRTFVLEAAAPPSLRATATLEQLPSTVHIGDDVALRFESALAERLDQQADISTCRSGDLIIRYRIVLFETGNAAVRFGSGVAGLVGSPFYGLGDGSVAVDVTFADPAGASLGHIVVDGPIAGAFGSPGDGLNAAAREIARYARENFSGRSGRVVALGGARMPGAGRP